MTVAGCLAATIDDLHPERRVLVAIDGPDAAGKSTLACAIREQLHRPVVSASIDRWHRPRAFRMRRGEESPEGYYRDSFDYEALTAHLLVPFRQGAAHVTVALFDHVCDRVDQRRQAVQPASALLVDGVFLLRPELRAVWDLSVSLEVPESVTLARAATRDSGRHGDENKVLRRYRERYLPGQAIYRRESCPHDVADIVVDNADVGNPQILRWRVRGCGALSGPRRFFSRAPGRYRPGFLPTIARRGACGL